MEGARIKIRGLDAFDFFGRTVIFRPDINSPIDIHTKHIVNTNRIEKTVPTLLKLLDAGAKVAIIAHQGDTLDYQNLMPLEEHARLLASMTGRNVSYVDDVCGPEARRRVKELRNGEAIVLGNLRYLTEEVSSFEKEVKLTPRQMLDTWLVRSLAPLADIYVNDAFAAAHRNAPSMVAFQELLPTAGGLQLVQEYTALKSVMDHPRRPCIFVLGGAKISDAFGMMRKVLEDGAADLILPGGLTGILMLLARGVAIGKREEHLLSDRDLLAFLPEAKDLLTKWGDRYLLPIDLAYEQDGKRAEVEVADLPTVFSDTTLYPDIGHGTIELFKERISAAGSIFVNGPAGMYEDERWADGTREIWNAIANAPGYTVVGGGDTINAATKFTDLSKYSYVCTAGGAMVRFLAGKKLPLIEAMERAFEHDLQVPVGKRDT
ncbi:MAG: phosphoglycerate kinase [Sphaerochaetaceae bacterium]|jgi:phosphoglycerate kinase